MNRLALIFIIIGSINWLFVGLFQFDLIAALFGSQSSFLSRIGYIMIGISGIYAITFLFRDRIPA